MLNYFIIVFFKGVTNDWLRITSLLKNLHLQKYNLRISEEGLPWWSSG